MDQCKTSKDYVEGTEKYKAYANDVATSSTQTGFQIDAFRSASPHIDTNLLYNQSEEINVALKTPSLGNILNVALKIGNINLPTLIIFILKSLVKKLKKGVFKSKTKLGERAGVAI